MRVTANDFTNSMVSQLNVLTSRQYNLQNQVSTGLRITAPADDPAAMKNTLDYQAQKAAQAQYSSNIATLQSRATSAYDVLQSLQTVSSRVGEIATLASDDTKSSAQLASYGGEVNQLLEQTLQLANTQDAATGRYLFGGTSDGQPPYVATKDANGNITGVTYQGNESVNQTEIAAGVTVAVDVPGANNSGSGARGLFADSRSGADMFSHLIALRDNLNAGNPAAIAQTDAANVQKDGDNLLFHISSNGVIQNRLNTTATMVANRSQSLDKMISDSSSADVVQTMVQLNQAQTAYQAALQSGAKIMQLSILNYLS